MEYLYYVLLAIASYFLGNITWGRLVAKAHNDDITKHGSGNPGTLNVWRTFGFWSGVLTFALDMIKAVIPTLVAYLTFGYLGCNPEIALYVAGFSVVVGHIFPVIYGFKGGKGIATSIGVFLVANWWVALICFAVMIIIMLFVKYGFLADLLFVLAMSIVEICLCNPANWVNYIFIGGILALVVFAHRANIVRFVQGRENKTELLKMLKGLFKKKPKEEK